jgi:hypothetical protein
MYNLCETNPSSLLLDKIRPTVDPRYNGPSHEPASQNTNDDAIVPFANGSLVNPRASSSASACRSNPPDRSASISQTQRENRVHSENRIDRRSTHSDRIKRHRPETDEQVEDEQPKKLQEEEDEKLEEDKQQHRRPQEQQQQQQHVPGQVVELFDKPGAYEVKQRTLQKLVTNGVSVNVEMDGVPSHRYETLHSALR